MSQFFESCPKCGNLYCQYVLYRPTLGAPIYQCASCGKKFWSRCVEWRSLNRRQKLFFLAVSLLASALLAFMVGLLVGLGCLFLNPKGEASRENYNAVIATGAICGFFCGALICYQRVRWSVERTSRGITFIPAKWMSVDSNPQGLCMTIVFTIGLMARAAEWIIYRR